MQPEKSGRHYLKNMLRMSGVVWKIWSFLIRKSRLPMKRNFFVWRRCLRLKKNMETNTSASVELTRQGADHWQARLSPERLSSQKIVKYCISMIRRNWVPSAEMNCLMRSEKKRFLMESGWVRRHRLIPSIYCRRRMRRCGLRSRIWRLCRIFF